MVDHRLLEFAGIAALLVMTPGADTLIVMRNTLSRGQAAGVSTAFGICTGLFIYASFSAFGISLILVRSRNLFLGVKLLGALYLILLGVQALIRAARWEQGAGIEPQTPAYLNRAARRHTGRSFGEGFLTNLLNPKVALFYVAFLPQFLRPDESILVRTSFLAGIHIILSIIQLSAVALLIGRFRGIFKRPTVIRRLEGITGIVLISLGARVAFEQQ